jgi:hypothetical protein
MQAQLLGLIRAPDGVRRAVAAGDLAERRALAAVVGDRRLSALSRVGIYADMYLLRLLEVLQEVYPTVAAVAGADAFRALVTDYLDAFPSRHPNLRRMGDRLAAFLRAPRARRPRCPVFPPWMADVAALEWARYDVFDEADDRLLSRARVAALPPAGFADLPIRFVAAHRVVPLDHAVQAVWRAVRAGRAPSAPEEAPTRLLVWRQGISVFHRPLDPLEQRLVAVAAPGPTPFGALCEVIARALDPAVAAQPSPVASTAFAVLDRWVTDEVLVHVS